MADQNGTATKAVSAAQDLSVQKRATQEANTGSATLWFSRDLDGSEISPWWSKNRDYDLDRFWKRDGNDILQGAISSMVKKFRSMNWTLTGPEKTVSRYQRLLSEAEFGMGWSGLIGKTLVPYLSQDSGGFWELIGGGDANGPLEGPVLGIAHLDTQFCQLTGDVSFPVVYSNPKTGKPHKMHQSRVVHFVDMPSPNELMHNVGFCAVSRVIATSSVLLKLARYKNEKLDDLPEAGLLIFNNILPQKWDDARADYARERRRMGQQYWANIMAFFSLDPAQQASAEFLNFSNLPDAFNEQEATEIYVNILALAFGVDVREFWPMSAGPLGTAAETTVQAQKAKGKGIGDIISTIERAVNWKILPNSVEFAFDFQDDEEDRTRAEIEKLKTDTIMGMWRPDAIEGGPVTRDEIRQMLADNIDYFKEEFLAVDMTDEVTEDDIDVAAYGRVVSVDSKGKVTVPRRRNRGRYISEAVKFAAENYRKGSIDAEQIAEFALSQLIEAETS
jgi:hypothetical protein